MIAEDAGDVLQWARARASALIGELEDPELLALLAPGPNGEPHPQGEADVSPFGVAPRSFRFEGSSVIIELRDWADLSRLYHEDIKRGGVFVSSFRPPVLRMPIDVSVELPEALGALHLRAEVVHIAANGSGLQFESMTDEMTLLFERVAAFEGRGFAFDAWVNEVRQGLRARLEGADAQVLGLRPGASADAIKTAYARLQASWESFLGEGDLKDRLEPVLSEYAALLGQLCARWVTSSPSRGLVSCPAPRRPAPRRRSVAPQAADPTASVRPQSPPTQADRAGAESEPHILPGREPEPDPEFEAVDGSGPAPEREPTSAVVQNARRFVERLSRRSRLASHDRPPPATGPSSAPSASLAPAYQQLAERNYEAAEQELKAFLKLDPRHEKGQQLLQFVRARKAVSDRDFAGAKRLYEDLLRRAPGHTSAKKELLMLAALG